MNLLKELSKFRARSAPAGGRKTMYYHDQNCLEGPISLALRNRIPVTLSSKGNGAVCCEPPFRASLVARIRREIAAGTYETPEKLAAALEAMLLRNAF
jgi:hypothetical protein